jgi:Holliday junction resolvase-like predicted endonuclease
MPDNFSHETLENIRPEENVHSNKVKRLSRAIQSYLAEKHVSPETEWEFSIIAVFIDRERKKAAIRFTPNIVL